MTAYKSASDIPDAQDAEHNKLDTPLSPLTEAMMTTVSSPASASASSTAPCAPAATSGDAPAAMEGVNFEQAHKPRLLIQKTHAAFVSKLYAMVSDTSTDSLISWTSEGDCFKVTDPMEFSRNVLPAYFKHGNWQSFVRQLNMYGFHKISDLAYGGIFGDMQLWMFKHPFFQRGELKMLQNVKRRGPKAAAISSSGSGSGSLTEASPLFTSSTQEASSALPEEQPVSGTEALQFHSCDLTHSKVEDKLYCNASANASALSSSTALASPCAHYKTTEAAPRSDSLAHQNIKEYVDDLKICIQELQKSNGQLHQENQKMHTTIANCQNAFAGIMSFLETAIVKPNTQVAEQFATPLLSAKGAYPGQSIADAFSKLVSDVAPVVSDLGCVASASFPAAINNRTGATPADTLLASPFRAMSSKFTDSEAPGSRHRHASQGQHRWRPEYEHEHVHVHSHERERQILPPIRLGPSAQSSEGPRIPSLSPPAAELSKKRRSSSSSSSCNNSEAGDADMQPLTPYIVLPPISGMVDSVISKHNAHVRHHEDIHPGQKTYTSNGNSSASSFWKAPRPQSNKFSAPHESSLRETLPQKRSRLD